MITQCRPLRVQPPFIARTTFEEYHEPLGKALEYLSFTSGADMKVHLCRQMDSNLSFERQRVDSSSSDKSRNNGHRRDPTEVGRGTELPQKTEDEEPPRPFLASQSSSPSQFHSPWQYTRLCLVSPVLFLPIQCLIPVPRTLASLGWRQFSRRGLELIG